MVSSSGGCRSLGLGDTGGLRDRMNLKETLTKEQGQGNAKGAEKGETLSVGEGGLACVG